MRRWLESEVGRSPVHLLIHVILHFLRPTTEYSDIVTTLHVKTARELSRRLLGRCTIQLEENDTTPPQANDEITLSSITSFL